MFKYVSEVTMFKYVAMVLLVGMETVAAAEALLPPVTMAGVEFTVLRANLSLIGPGAVPTARFSISMTNRGKSSLGLVIVPQASGASTDTGLDLRRFSSSLARGLHACRADCRSVRDNDWVILQPGQTINVLVPLWASGRWDKKHGRAETMDLTLVLMVQESGAGSTKVPLSLANIPIVNELR